MMDWLIESILFLPFLIGMVFMITAGIVFVFPPKKINYLYGYRTTASMRSQQRWDFAQKYSAGKMFQAGALSCLLSFSGLFFPNTGWIQMGIGLPLTISSCIFIFFTTERTLRKKFPNNVA